MEDTFDVIPKDDNMAKSSSRRPRVKADRLMSRFYEPLVLLHILDHNGGQRISRCPSGEVAALHLALPELRREFLDQLAYVCDHIKGGDTVTAMALEAQPSGVIFWVACNTKMSLKTICFLEGILSILQGLALSQDEHSKTVAEDDIVEQCIKFNLKRIKVYQRDMIRPFQNCLKILERSAEVADKLLADWLRSFLAFKTDLPGLCRYAYQQRSSPCLKELTRHIGETSEMTNIESKMQAFLLTRHFIGRLGSHLKASKVLVMAGWRLPNLFDNFTIRTQPSPKPASTPPPTDHLTTLDGIVKRMLPSGSDEVKGYQEALAIMDTKFDIQNRLLAEYKEKEFKPRVHAELNLLEHFHQNSLPFVDNDRFIGCSKPACYCCYHYISAHPGGFVRPSSHGKRYLNWRPPDLDDTLTREKRNQRDIMNKVISQIRTDALRQIRQCRGPSLWHPDSTTGITYSINRNGFRQQVNLLQDHETPINSILDREQEYEIPASSELTPSYPVSEEDENSGSDSDGGATL